jgi:hypothetical protein
MKSELAHELAKTNTLSTQLSEKESKLVLEQNSLMEIRKVASELRLRNQ